MSRFASRCAFALAFVSLVTQTPRVFAEETAPPPAPQIAGTTLAPRLDGRAYGACGTVSLDALAGSLDPAIVEVAGSSAWSLGFVFGEPDLVVAPYAVASRGRGVEVTYQGRTSSATIAAVDEQAGLALLRVAGLHVATTPLVASPLRVQVGTATVGFAWNWVDGDASRRQLSDGSVTAATGAGFRAGPNAAVGYAWGGPLVDCRGRVLGMSSWSNDVVPVRAVEALRVRVQSGEAPYEGGWSFANPTFHGLLEIDANGEAWGGLDLGDAAVRDDRLEIGLTGRFLGRGDPQPGATASWSRREWGVRAGGDAHVGYRLMMTEGAMPIYLVPHVGAGFDVTVRGVDVSRQRAATNCAAPCPVVTESRSLPDDVRARAVPTVGLATRLGFVDLDYTLRFDVGDLSRSSHQVGFGFQF